MCVCVCVYTSYIKLSLTEKLTGEPLDRRLIIMMIDENDALFLFLFHFHSLSRESSFQLSL